MTRIVNLLCGCLLTLSTQAQELNCQVNINYDQLAAQQKADLSYFEQLKGAITDLLNNRRWTNNQFQPSERINCTLNINLLKSTQIGAFEGNAQLVLRRPIYGTNLETNIITYVDRSFNIIYLPTQPVFYRDNIYTDELTSIVGFYAYLFLALDHDTFKNQGGSQYMQQAFNIMNLAQQSGGAGWSVSGDKRNRYNLIENYQAPQFLPFREALYNYHRSGCIWSEPDWLKENSDGLARDDAENSDASFDFGSFHCLPGCQIGRVRQRDV
jgi:hypothetical protein